MMMKRRRQTSCSASSVASARRSSSNMMRPVRCSIALCFLLFLTLSKASRSFQPASSSAPHSHKQQQQQRETSSTRNFFQTTSSAVRRRKLSPALEAVSFMRDWGTNNKKDTLLVDTRSSSAVATVSRVAPKTDYQKRKEEWANRYTNLDSLRDTFGANRNKMWGDLDPGTARRLYKTLLPKALLELVKVGVHPEDLAPLAYQARVAAKLYARERCQVPARIGASLFDGFRHLKRYGKFQTCGMSYDQVWEKYHKVILDEHAAQGLKDQDVTAKICLKILERSCTTNDRIDRWVLPPEDQGEREDLESIAQTLERDVRKLLDPVVAAEDDSSKSKRHLKQYRVLRLIARARRRAKRRMSERSPSNE